MKLYLMGLVTIIMIGLPVGGRFPVIATTSNSIAYKSTVTPGTPLPTVTHQVLTTPSSTPRPYHPKVALIIDDVGLQREWAAEFYKIPAPLTWSVLPFQTYTQECAAAGKQAGFQVILHLPLDPFRGTKPPGEGFIIKGSLEEEIIRQFEADLAQVPEAVGLNNHMGSTSREDEYLTAVLMSQAKKRNLFYVDSVTGTFSVARKYARLYQVPFARRDVFIDHYHSVESKVQALHELIKIALKYGQAIGIGHVRPGTATAIAMMLPEFEKAGIKIVPVSKLVAVEPEPQATPEPTRK